MNKRIERCTVAAVMALGSLAVAGILTTAQAALPAVKHQGSCLLYTSDAADE